MKDNAYASWRQMHNDLESIKQSNYELYCGWQDSLSNNIDPNKSIPRKLSDSTFDKIKKQSKNLYVHANYVLEKMHPYLDESGFGIALFNREGCLLKLYGCDQFMDWSKGNKIEKKTIWDSNTIGASAISQGLELRKPVAIIGEEHFCEFAIHIAAYFSPIIVENDAHEKVLYGGIAIVGPIQKRSPHFLISVVAISREISSHLFWYQNINIFADIINDECGLVGIDQSNGKNHILITNKNIFGLLKMPYQDLYYKQLEEFIDPIPKNKDLWRIINKREKISDTLMQISVAGKIVPISVSTHIYYDKKFHIEGMNLVFNSPQRITNLISSHTGNNARFTFNHIIGKNEEYLDVLNHAKAASLCDSNILLLGESGVGKDIIAQAIHNASQRKNNPFIAINCAALPKDLISSELFGYDEGAFTGARKGGNIGKFEVANKGTIFLDEIGDMPLDLQATLLRVIEDKSIMRIGSNIATTTDVRIIAATNKNLIEKIRQKEFREDLFYRLGIIRMHIPPLRERKDDIPLLLDHFIKIICKRVGKPMVQLSPEVRDFFIKNHWPGNVRELQNLLEGIIQIYNVPIIQFKHIKDSIDHFSYPVKNNIFQNHTNSYDVIKDDASTSKQEIKACVPDSKEYIIKALQQNQYNKTKTADALGISRRTLYRRLKEYDLMD